MTLKIAKILICLIDGESIAASSVKSKLIDNLVRENIVFRKGKHRKTLSLLSENGLRLYLANQLQINDLYKYISALENENSSRAEFVKITTNSKHSKERAFQGFLVNCYSPIRAELNHQQITLHPAMGSFVFIYDYKTFKIPAEVTVVGVENAKNFSQIHQQKYLFEDITPLFASRYPQNQNKDFIKWMQSIPNKYLHFGDFDVAGIGIYLNEYKKHLGSKANFFIPENIGKVLQKSGNRERYNKQKINFKSAEIEEKRLLQLLKIIQTEKKGLDQEVYIKT